MAATSGDVKIYSVANRPENDVSAFGGAVNTAVKVTFSQMGGQLRVTSTGPGDNQTVTARGRDSTGIVVSENIVLNGTAQVSGSQTFQRILSLAVPNTHTGSITISRQSDQAAIAVMESGITGVVSMFINAKANPASLPTRNYYEKAFIYNSNTGSALLNMTVQEVADTSALVTFALESGINGNTSITGRLDTIPTGITTFSNGTISLPNVSLGPNSGVAVWLNLNLPSGTAGNTGSYSLNVSFDSA